MYHIPRFPRIHLPFSFLSVIFFFLGCFCNIRGSTIFIFIVFVCPSINKSVYLYCDNNVLYKGGLFLPLEMPSPLNAQSPKYLFLNDRLVL